MKIYYGSDLHLEFGESLPFIPEGDLLILAGDIFLPWLPVYSNKGDVEKAKKDLRVRFSKFFAECSAKFDKVILIAGNHEHYGGLFYDTNDKIKEWIAPYANIQLLNNEVAEFNTFNIFGSTFWTDCKGFDPQVMMEVQRSMNDYFDVYISRDAVPGRSSKLRAIDTTTENTYSRKKLLTFLSECHDNGKFPLVVTHHNPSWFCVPQRFKVDLMTYGYSNTGLDDVLLDYPTDLIWVCGHTHDPFDDKLGNCRILRNCRGYVGIEQQAKNFKFKLIKGL